MNPHVLSLLLIAAMFAACGQNPEIDNPEGKDGPAGTRSDEIPSFSIPLPDAETMSMTLTAEQKSYVYKGNEFAVRLLKEVGKTADGSFVLSPLSIQYALSMAVNGAQGETAAEIMSALGLGSDVSALNDYSRTMLEKLSALDFDVSLKMADAMVVSGSYTLSQSTKESVESSYYAPVVALSFKNADGVTSKVNDWFRTSSGGLYSGIAESLSPQSSGYLLSGLGFKAGWGVPWDDVEGKMPFYANGGVKDLDCLEIRYAPLCCDIDGGRIALFTLGKGTYWLNVILPSEGHDLPVVMSSLTWDGLSAALSSVGYLGCHVKIPAFSVESALGLKDVLAPLGITRAFDGSRADFSPLVSEPGFHFDDALHKARLSFDGNGTGGAERVPLQISVPTSEPFEPVEWEGQDFFVDHPFAFLITERISNVILFAGVFDGK